MTPTAATSAGRATTKRHGGEEPRKGGERRKLRQPPAPPVPRRVSGPLKGLERSALPEPRGRERSALAKSPLRGPDGRALQKSPPRSVTPRRAGSVSRDRLSLPSRAGAFVRSLPDQALLDRVLRGRAWIPLLGVMLVGIVAMQVEVLKLGTSIGRSLQLGTALQSRNELLRASVASLGDGQRIERLAAGLGMVMPGPAAVGFLASAPETDVQKALASIHAPNRSSFIARLPPGAPGSAPTTGTSTSTSGISSTPTSVAPSTSGTSAAPRTATSAAPSTSGTAATGG